MSFARDCISKAKHKVKWNFSLWFRATLHIGSILAISERGPSLAWPASPTCLWKASWSVAPGWNPWASSLHPTPCCTGTCTSWRTKSGMWLTYGVGCREGRGSRALPVGVLGWALRGKGCTSERQMPHQEHPWLSLTPRVVVFVFQPASVLRKWFFILKWQLG